jgi:HrpA-like RNA helicase
MTKYLFDSSQSLCTSSPYTPFYPVRSKCKCSKLLPLALAWLLSPQISQRRRLLYPEFVMLLTVVEQKRCAKRSHWFLFCNSNRTLVQRRYDVNNGVQTFQVSWISKASAAQRAGRAGRTGPGHCYRLYSSALFENNFEEFSRPEILRMPIEGVVLQMKSMHIDTVINFPFPTPPERSTIRQAEVILTHLGALNAPSGTEVTAPQITDLGRTMSLFPLSPRYSRMLVSGQQQGCLPYVISVVSALCVGNPFLYDDEFQDEDEDSLRSEAGLAHLTSKVVKAKEARRSRRKAFFESQHVGLNSLMVPKIKTCIFNPLLDPCCTRSIHERYLESTLGCRCI